MPIKLQIEIKENFLSKGYMPNEEPYKHNSLWEGYLEYVLDELVLQYRQWAIRNYRYYRVPSIEIKSVRYIEKDKFEVEIDKEDFDKSRQELANAIFLYYDHRYRESVLNMRTAIEIALPEKVGLFKKSGERLLWVPLLKIYKEVYSDFPKKELETLYGRASDFTHVDGRPIKDIILCRFYYEVRKILKKIQKISLTQEQIQLIKPESCMNI